MLNNILLDARRNNLHDDVTGALICRHDIFLQLLEGPAANVEATFHRIKRDDRHVDIRLHVSELAPKRMFGNWAMLHDPARSRIWSIEEVADGALERATPTEVTAFFIKLEIEARSTGKL